MLSNQSIKQIESGRITKASIRKYKNKCIEKFSGDYHHRFNEQELDNFFLAGIEPEDEPETMQMKKYRIYSKFKIYTLFKMKQYINYIEYHTKHPIHISSILIRESNELINTMFGKDIGGIISEYVNPTYKSFIKDIRFNHPKRRKDNVKLEHKYRYADINDYLVNKKDVRKVYLELINKSNKYCTYNHTLLDGLYSYDEESINW